MSTQIIGLSKLDYNRSQKQWQLQHNGQDNAIFPAGIDGRANAVRLAIKLQDPELFYAAERIAAKHPQLNRRAWKAAILILNKEYQAAGPLFQALITINSDSRDKRHLITARDNQLLCTCEDFQFEQAPALPQTGRCCKHILVALILSHLGRWDLTQEPRR